MKARRASAKEAAGTLTEAFRIYEKGLPMYPGFVKNILIPVKEVVNGGRTLLKITTARKM